MDSGQKNKKIIYYPKSVQPSLKIARVVYDSHANIIHAEGAYRAIWEDAFYLRNYY